MSKVFLIGRRRTGIQTIRKALEVVGFKKSSILSELKSEKIEDLISTAKKYDFIAVVRDYTMNDVRAIESAYPDCRFILTKRDTEIWYASFVRYYNTLKGDHPQTVHTNKGHYASKFYDEYNNHVKAHFLGRDWKLLTMVFDGSHSWGNFCSYFKKPIPATSFPHENRS